MVPYYRSAVLLQTCLSLHGHIRTLGYFFQIDFDRRVVLTHFVLQEFKVAV